MEIIFDLRDALMNFSMLFGEIALSACLPDFDIVVSLTSLLHYVHDIVVVFVVTPVAGTTCCLIIV